MTDRGRYWRDVVRTWKQSGLSQAAFCRKHGIKPVTFGWWKRKLVGTAGTRRQCRGGTSRTSGKKYASAKTGSVTARFIEMPLDHSCVPNGQGAMPPAGYEVMLPDGPMIRLPHDFDPDRVERLVLALQSSC
jgi:hypothetical protein